MLLKNDSTNAASTDSIWRPEQRRSGQRIPARHLLGRINPAVTCGLAGVREKLQPDIGRPSIDPKLMIRFLIVARKLCEEVELRLAYRWFCRLALDDKVPHHLMFSVNRHGRFRGGDLFRQVLEAVVPPRYNDEYDRTRG